MTTLACPWAKHTDCVRRGGNRAYCKVCDRTGNLARFLGDEIPRGKDVQQQELFALRRQVKDLEAQARDLMRESADTAALKEWIGTAQSKLLTADAPAFEIKKTGNGKALIHGVPTLMLSDLHVGEVVFSEQVGGINAYNKAIAKRRLSRVIEGAVKLLRETLSPGLFGGMSVILGGDMVEGVIHDEIRETADLTVMEAVIYLHDLLVPHLYALADEFGKLHVACVAGNHGRLDRKPRIKQRQKLNFDWLLYQFLMRTIGESKYADRITFQVPEGDDAAYRIYNTRYLLTHGDKFTGGNGICGPILPWMRGDMKTRKQYGAMGAPYDWLVMGHWHQLRYLEGIIVNGCLPGFNEYAMRMGFGYEPPQQALWLTHPIRGVTFREAIWADEPKAPEKAPWVSVK